MVGKAALRELRAIERAREKARRTGDDSVLIDALRKADPDLIKHTSEPVKDAEIKQATEDVDQRVREANRRARSNRAARERGKQTEEVTKPRVATPSPQNKYFYDDQAVSREEYYQAYQPKRHRVVEQVMMTGAPRREVEFVGVPGVRPVQTRAPVQIDTTKSITSPISKERVELFSREFGEIYVKELGHVVGSVAKGVIKPFYAPNYFKGAKPGVDFGQHKVLKSQGALYADPDVQAAASVAGFIALQAVPVVGPVAAGGLAVGMTAERVYHYRKTGDPRALAHATLAAIPFVPKAMRGVRRSYIRAVATKIPPEEIFSKEVLSGEQQFPVSRTAQESLLKFRRSKTEKGGVEVLHAAEAPPESRPRQIDVKKTPRGSSDSFDTKREIIVGEGPMAAKGLEDPGLYVTPVGEGSPHFLRIPGKTDVELTLLPSVNRPAAVVVEVMGVERQPLSVLHRPGFKATRRYLESRVPEGKAFITKRSEAGFRPEIDPTLRRAQRTRELEAVIPAGTQLVSVEQVPRGLSSFKGFSEYTEFKGELVPIVRYRTVKSKTPKQPGVVEAGDVSSKYQSLSRVLDPRRVDVVSSFYSASLQRAVSSVLSRSPKVIEVLSSEKSVSGSAKTPPKVSVIGLVSRDIEPLNRQLYELSKATPLAESVFRLPAGQSAPAARPDPSKSEPLLPDPSRFEPPAHSRPRPSGPGSRGGLGTGRSPFSPDRLLDQVPDSVLDPFFGRHRRDHFTQEILSRVKPVRQPKKYTPTLTSSLMKIEGTPSKAGSVTGLGIRPVPVSRKKKKRKKKNATIRI